MSALKVRDVMTKDPQTVFVDETVDLAHIIMSLGRIRHLPVVDRENKLVGLITHRDVLRSSVGKTVSKSDRIPIEETMVKDPVTVNPDSTALEAAKTLRKYMFGALPVVSPKEGLVGIITEADFVELAATFLSDTST